MLRVARFLHSYLRHPPPWVDESETSFTAGGDEVPASLFRRRDRVTGPGWVVLHGITVPGRRHPGLLRFVRSLAGTGGIVLVPEIRIWKELRVDPEVAETTILAAARHLARHPAVAPGGVGVVGFSFGATQALITAANPELKPVLRSVVGFGGYCDLERAIRFMTTGEHEWAGRTYRLDPDPYGRWIVAANYLTDVPEYAGLGAVADAARALATEAGTRFVYAGDPQYDELKAQLRAGLGAAEREIWDLIAPPTTTAPPREPARELARRLADAALRRHPRLDPRPVLPTLDHPVVLAHGYGDLLVPFSESLRLHAQFPPDADVTLSITRLFAHSRAADRLRLREYPLESWRYVRLLAAALR